MDEKTSRNIEDLMDLLFDRLQHELRKGEMTDELAFIVMHLWTFKKDYEAFTESRDAQVELVREMTNMLNRDRRRKR